MWPPVQTEAVRGSTPRELRLKDDFVCPFWEENRLSQAEMWVFHAKALTDLYTWTQTVMFHFA